MESMTKTIGIAYLVTPFLAWLVAGSTKFLLNCLLARKLTTELIGYGGFPSNHSAIVSSTATLIALCEGIQHPAFGVALTLAFVVMMDANSLRKHIGYQAEIINQLTKSSCLNRKLRERIGHSRIEIVGGAIIGALVGFGAFLFF